MLTKKYLEEICTFENHLAITFNLNELWEIAKKLNKRSKELNDESILDIAQQKRKKTKPLTESACALLLKEIIKADPDNKDSHIDALLNPELSEQRKYIQKNFDLVPEEIKNYKNYLNSIKLPNLNAESEITYEKHDTSKIKAILLKLAFPEQ
jgi:hypothetical protein